MKVHKARAGNLDLVEITAGTHVLDQPGCDISRTHVCGFCEPHRDVAGKVAMTRIARPLNGALDREIGSGCGQLWQLRQRCLENVSND